MSSETGHRELELLSEYLDGELAGRRRTEVERHLAGCAACRAVLDELRAVAAGAARVAAVSPPPPADDLWPGILARLDDRAATPAVTIVATPGGGWLGRRFAFSLPQLAAAAALLVLMSGGAMWMLLRSGTTPAGPVGTVAVRSANPAPPSGGAPPSTPVAAETGSARPEGSYAASQTAAVAGAPDESGTDARLASYDFTRYDATIAELQNVIHTHSAELDTSTVRVIQQNLSLIDHAIGDARRALEADPANPYLNGHLAQQLQRKVRLLQQATGLVAVHQS